MNNAPSYWFPAKRYGWGWGWPSNWQGKLVYLAYALLMLVGGFILRPDQQPLAFLAYTLVLSALLLGICWVKGERPAWRWGNSDA